MSYVITTEIDINAGPEAVWGALVDFPRYGQWSTFSRVEGTAQVGNRLSMKMPGFSFRSAVTLARPGEQLQWSGTLISERLFLGRHTFILLAKPDATTHLTNHEEFSGGLTTLMQRFMKQSNDNGYTAFNAGLKRHVEEGATQQSWTK